MTAEATSLANVQDALRDDSAERIGGKGHSSFLATFALPAPAPAPEPVPVPVPVPAPAPALSTDVDAAVISVHAPSPIRISLLTSKFFGAMSVVRRFTGVLFT
jgi:hypothetical protein